MKVITGLDVLHIRSLTVDSDSCPISSLVDMQRLHNFCLGLTNTLMISRHHTILFLCIEPFGSFRNSANDHLCRLLIKVVA